MTEAVKYWFKKHNQAGPGTLAEVFRCIYDSLALAYSEVIAQLTEVTGRTITELRIVGGGTQDQFLNQLCADVCQIKVSTEPTEASALGNVVNQFISSDVITCLEEARQIIDASSIVHYFTPNHVEGLSLVKSRFRKITK